MVELNPFQRMEKWIEKNTLTARTVVPTNNNRTYENDAYEAWREAPDAEKGEWEEMLFEEVRNHAIAVVWTRMAEFDPDLAQEIVCAVYDNLPRFRGDCQFGTFVHAIARNK